LDNRKLEDVYASLDLEIVVLTISITNYYSQSQSY